MITMIGALSQNNCVGIDNTLPWKIPSDLKFFKEKTLNKTVVMGYNTFISLNEKPLPNRKNIVVSNNKNNKNKNFEFLTFLEIIELSKYEDLFIIGGPKTWELFKVYCDEALITRVQTNIDGDSFVSDDFFKSFNFKNLLKTEYDTSKDEYNYLIEHYVK